MDSIEVKEIEAEEAPEVWRVIGITTMNELRSSAIAADTQALVADIGVNLSTITDSQIERERAAEARDEIKRWEQIGADRDALAANYEGICASPHGRLSLSPEDLAIKLAAIPALRMQADDCRAVAKEKQAQYDREQLPKRLRSMLVGLIAVMRLKCRPNTDTLNYLPAAEAERIAAHWRRVDDQEAERVEIERKERKQKELEQREALAKATEEAKRRREEEAQAYLPNLDRMHFGGVVEEANRLGVISPTLYDRLTAANLTTETRTEIAQHLKEKLEQEADPLRRGILERLRLRLSEAGARQSVGSGLARHD